MAVSLSLLNANTIENINTNFTRVQTALQDSVSRSGTTPNFINADLDLNSNDVLNVGRIDVQEFYMDGQPIVSIPGFEAIIEIAPDIITVANISDEVVAVAGNASAINLVGTNIVDVITVSGLAPSLDAIIANSTNINTVAVNIDNVNTVATNIASINTVSMNIANVNAVVGNATNINTVASNNANINTVVSNLPAILDAPNQATAAANSAAASAASAANALLSENTVAMASVPAGTILMRFGPLLPGYIAWGEGGTFNRTTYPALATWLDTNGASLGLSAPQIAAGTIPDWRDYSPRTAGGTLGPAVGSKQLDAFQGHNRQINADTGVVSLSSTGAVIRPGTSGLSQAQMSLGNYLDDGVNGVPRTASETRVKSFGVRWQIKAFGAAVDQGTVVISALAAQVTDNTNRITVLEARPFSKEYVSAQQTITSGGSLTLAHGLGVMPKILVAELVCLTAEFGYLVGDVLDTALFNTAAAATRSWGAVLTKTNTTISITYGAEIGVFAAHRKDTAAVCSFTNANWRLVVRAWA